MASPCSKATVVSNNLLKGNNPKRKTNPTIIGAYPEDTPLFFTIQFAYIAEIVYLCDKN